MWSLTRRQQKCQTVELRLTFPHYLQHANVAGVNVVLAAIAVDGADGTISASTTNWQNVAAVP